MLSSDDYYINVGKNSLDLKNQIENNLKEKKLFDDELLEGIEFSDDLDTYLIYSILSKKFEFTTPFDRLSSDYFGDNTNSKVEYFGITADSDLDLLNNVEILFFEDNYNFAIKLLTNNNEEIILLKTENEENFGNLYQSINKYVERYEGRNELKRGDSLRIPLIQLDTIINYNDLCGKKIIGTDGAYIQNALQNIKFYLNENGGEVTSNAVIKEISQAEYDDSYNFDFSSEFYIFMKENNSKKPYMALKVNNNDILIEAEEKVEDTVIITDLSTGQETYKNISDSNYSNISSDPYIPKDIKVTNDDYEGYEDNNSYDNMVENNKSINNIVLEVDNDSISKNELMLVITDNNDPSYEWTESFSIQTKKDNEWIDKEAIRELNFNTLGYNLDNNNQIHQKIMFSKYYGELEEGIYRIVKTIYNDNEYINVYSNEFEIIK